MSAHGGMTCRELVDLLTAYLDGALSPEQAAGFEEHLRECPPCVTELERARVAISTTGAIGPGEVDPQARERLLDIYREWRREGGR